LWFRLWGLGFRVEGLRLRGRAFLEPFLGVSFEGLKLRGRTCSSEKPVPSLQTVSKEPDVASRHARRNAPVSGAVV
jgi:hypothetical protein